MCRKQRQVRISKENVDYLQKRFLRLNLSLSQMVNTIIRGVREEWPNFQEGPKK